MRAEDVAEPVDEAERADRGLYLGGDVDELLAAAGGDLEGRHGGLLGERTAAMAKTPPKFNLTER